MIIESDLFIKLISWNGKPAAITLWPFIIISPKRISHIANSYNSGYEISKAIMLNHEFIHVAQQKELWLIGFYFLYLYYFFKYLIRTRNFSLAYFHIPFEQEAYYQQSNTDYLTYRRPHSWKNYLNK